MELDLRLIRPGEIEGFIYASGRGFSEHSGEDHIIHGKAILELDRTLAMFDGSEIVGTTSSYSYDINVPGGELPLAGVAWVTVQPTHRRRGILREMMTRQLKDIHERGEPLAGLWASESIIYGRFGYGMATFTERWSIDKRHTDFLYTPERSGRIRFIDAEQAKEVLPEVYEHARSTRHGMIKRSEKAWGEELGDPEIIRGGATAYFFVVHEQDGRIDGYVKYRINHANNKVIVYELIHLTNEAYAALWQYCFGIDLMEHTDAFNRPVDDPLIWMLADPRRLQRRPGDAMWVRLVDVRAALSGRRYAEEGRVVFDVEDDVCPWNRGRFELKGSSSGAECRPTQSDPDIALSAADLGAVYMGATPFRILQHAGRVREKTPGAIKRADAMFRTERQPWPAHDF